VPHHILKPGYGPAALCSRCLTSLVTAGNSWCVSNAGVCALSLRILAKCNYARQYLRLGISEDGWRLLFMLCCWVETNELLLRRRISPRLILHHSYGPMTGQGLTHSSKLTLCLRRGKRNFLLNEPIFHGL